MIWPPPFPSLLLLVAALISAAVAGYTWRRRATVGAWQLSLILFAVIIWTLGYALELSSSTLDAKLVWVGVQYLGIAFLPTLWLRFVLAYTGRRRLLSGGWPILWFAFPTLTVALNWTNPAHRLLYRQVSLDLAGPLPQLTRTPGPWYWANIGYAYLCILIGVCLLGGPLRHAAPLYRRQAAVILAGVCVPWLANLAYISGVNPLAPLDPTPFAFVITGLITAWGLLRYRLLDLLPMARERVIGSMADAVVVLDADQLIVDMNPAAQRLFAPVAVLGFPVALILAEWPDLLQACRQRGEVRLELKRDSLTRRWFEVQVSPLRDAGGWVRGQLLIWHDITDRKHAEEALHDALQRFEAIVEQTPLVAIQRFDQAGVIQHWNAACQTCFGFSGAEARGRRLQDLVLYPEDVPAFELMLEAIWRSAQPPQPRQWQARTKDGDQRWLYSTMFPIFSHGQVSEVIRMDVDITELRQTEALLQRRLRFIELIQQITTDFVRVDIAQIDEQIIAVLREVATLFAVERGYVFLIAAERGLVELTHEWCGADVPSHCGVLDAVSMVEFADYLDLLRGGAVVRVQARDVPRTPANQALIDVIDRLKIKAFVNVPLFISGQLIGWIGFDAVLRENGWTQETVEAFQLTGQLIASAIQRKRAAEALRLSELRFRSLFSHMAEGVALHRVVYDADGRAINYEILDVNPQYEQILKLRREDVRNRLANQAYNTPEPPYLSEFTAVGISGQPVQFETFFAPMGRFFMISVSPLAPDHFATIFYDITERKRVEQEQERLQAQLLQAQKMEAIGHLAGGIAHDFNNILTVISGNADLALATLPPQHLACEDLQAIQHSADRAAQLVRQLLTFARRQASQPEVVDLNELVQGITPMLRRLIGEHISLIVQPGQALERVRIDPLQFEQVLINLVVNARDAMPAGGTLTIATANTFVAATDLRRPAEAAPGSYVALTVSDTGVGMTDEVQAHIFEPYFTTKEVGHGTGLGLATCLGIITQQRGFLWVESAPGRGSRFSAYLPSTTALPSPLARPASRARLGRGTETVLVVEDESDVRQLAVRILSAHGYRVLEAASGQEAQQLAETLAEQPIHLLLTDLIMPWPGGLELARRLHAQRPDLKVLLMSGYADVLHGVGEQPTADLAFLQKPFSQATLLEHVHRVLS